MRGLNLVGLKRNNVPDEEVKILKKFYSELFKSKDGTFKSRLEIVTQKYAKYSKPNEILEFIKNNCRKSLTMAD